MSDHQVRVTFEPQGRSVTVLPGTKIVEAAAQAGLTIDVPCGGQGLCGKCRVQITRSAREPGERERACLSASDLDQGWRLACQAPIPATTTIHVPETSLFGGQHQILAERQQGVAQDVNPAVRKLYVEMAPPTLAQCEADLTRLERHIGAAKVDLSLLRCLPSRLRNGNFKGTAVMTDHHLIDFEPGNTSGRCFGMAFDIGTTTIVGSLLDMKTGHEVGLAADINPQVSFGDDVISRIEYSSKCDRHLHELQKTIMDAVSKLIKRACKEAAVSTEEIYEVTFAGNTTMEHLLCGIETAQLGQVPFVPAHAKGLLLPAAEFGLPIHPRGTAYVFPVIGGFVGGDTVAGMLVTRIDQLDGPVLMVDIGTNSEIVLAHQGKLWAASTSAGPAFEGAKISCGMRATRGAIEKVVFDGDVRLGTIGNAQPVGLCGSGLIDAAAELLRHGIVSPEGRMLSADELPASLVEPLRKRVFCDGEHIEFRLHEDAKSEGRRPLALTQRDLRELQLANGAIRAGIRIVCKQAGIRTSDLGRVLIAGGFGSFIRRSNALRIGLLPTDVPHERIAYVGNASLDGAKWALLSTNARKRAEELAHAALHVELSQDSDFQTQFTEAMIFPECKEIS